MLIFYFWCLRRRERKHKKRCQVLMMHQPPEVQLSGYWNTFFTLNSWHCFHGHTHNTPGASRRKDPCWIHKQSWCKFFFLSVPSELLRPYFLQRRYESFWHAFILMLLSYNLYHLLRAFGNLKAGKWVPLVFKKSKLKQHYILVNTLTAVVDKPVGSICSHYLAVHAVYIIHCHKMLKMKPLALLQTNTRQC